MDNLDKLNRLRENAGKKPLASWKASQAKLGEAIKILEDQGFTDILPGANPEVQPITDDPEVAKNLPLTEEKTEEKVETIQEDPKPAPKKIKGKPSLANGLGTDGYARHSRKAVEDHRAKEKRDKKEDPDKAERQKKHIEEKREKRKAEGKLKPPKEKNDNEITVADIARELGIDPRVARAKLRRNEDKIKDLHTKGQDRWTFPKSVKSDIMKILK